MRPPSDNGIGILERLEGREIGRAKLGRGAKSKPDLNSLFERYDELAGDVARSKHQFFQSNVQRWLEFLDSTAPFTKPILQQLEGPVDFNIWFQPYKVVGIAGGTKTFEWPQERNERLGLQLLLFRQFATGNVEPGIFALTILSSGRNINDGISDIIDQIFLPMSRELKHYLREVTGPPEVPSEDVSVNAARRNDEIKRYESELAGILSRFTHSRDSVDIRREDDPLFRQYVRELIDLFNDLGEKKYSRQIAAEFDQGSSNFLGSPSYQSVDNILGIVRAALTRFERNPGLLIENRTASSPPSNKVFIVHGRAGAEQAVARFLGQLGLDSVILHEQPNQGWTVIEKFEAHSDVGFAVVLLTPDDLGGPKDGEQHPRARQNVILELGYFIGKLGRSHVCALKQDEIELPSDILGVLWELLDDHGGWQLKLARELRAAGYKVDLNKAAHG